MTKTIFYAKSLNELLKILTNNSDIKIVGGCTSIENLPQKFVSTFGIQELCKIERHEQYIEVGSGTSLSKILDLGENHLPPILFDALKSIANPNIRNIATIGGNICSTEHKHTLFSALMALNAKLEFKNLTETKIESIRNFKTVPQHFILTKIRIPKNTPDLSIFRRVGPENQINSQSASYSFIADTERNSLLKIRIAFAGPFVFQSSTLENSLIGTRLPLLQKDIIDIENMFIDEFNRITVDQMISDVIKQQFFNLVRYSFEQLS